MTWEERHYFDFLTEYPVSTCFGSTSRIPTGSPVGLLQHKDCMAKRQRGDWPWPKRLPFRLELTLLYPR